MVTPIMQPNTIYFRGHTHDGYQLLTMNGRSAAISHDFVSTFGWLSVLGMFVSWVDRALKENQYQS